jgi:hypothetical protein
LRKARVCAHVRFIEHTEYGLCYENNVAIFEIKGFSCEMLFSKEFATKSTE